LTSTVPSSSTIWRSAAKVYPSLSEILRTTAYCGDFRTSSSPVRLIMPLAVFHQFIVIMNALMATTLPLRSVVLILINPYRRGSAW
jgi:hypothetical protein